MQLEGPIDLEEFLASFQSGFPSDDQHVQRDESSVLDAWKELAGVTEHANHANPSQKQLLPLMTPISKSASRDSLLGKLEEVWEPSFETPAGTFSRASTNPPTLQDTITTTPSAMRLKKIQSDELSLNMLQQLPSSPKDLFTLRSEYGEMEFSGALDDVIANATHLTPMALRSAGLGDADDMLDDVDYDYLEDIDFDGQPFTQIHCNSESKRPEKDNVMMGFQTAAGKILEMPKEESILKAKALLMEDLRESTISNAPEPEVGGEMPLGFKTAGGNKIKDPSAASLNRARHLIEDIAEPPPLPVMSGFATASGAKIKISDESFKKAKRLFDENNDDTNKVDPIPMSGFATAKGKNLPPPSSESMAKAQSLLKDESPDRISSEIPFFSSGAGKVLPPPSLQNLKKAKMILEDPSSPSTETSLVIPPTFQSGFEYSSGSCAPPPSESSVVRPRTQFSDPFDKTPSTSNHSPRFSSAFKPFRCNNGITPMTARSGLKLFSSPQFKTPCRITRSGSTLKMEIKNEPIAPKAFFDWTVTERRLKLSSMLLEEHSDDMYRNLKEISLIF